jgi:hypothetical protein
MLKRIKEAQRVRIAVHEAGHAVLAIHYGFHVFVLTIVPNPRKRKAGAENHSLDYKKSFEDAGHETTLCPVDLVHLSLNNVGGEDSPKCLSGR